MFNIPNKVNAEAKDFRAACPDMILIKDEPRADYTLATAWAGNKWRVALSGKGQSILYEDVSPDIMETFRQSCSAIRDDAKESVDFNAHTVPQTVGRYVLQSTPPNRLFLLDTKTGSVWELQDLGLYQEFEHVRVEGLYEEQQSLVPKH
jgi:hypothetical protein